MKPAGATHSLQRHLSGVLTGVILIAGSIAAVFSFFFAFGEAQEFQDDGLRQVAALSIGNASQIAALDASHHAVIDPESRIEIIRLPDDDRPTWLPAALAPGFHTLAVPGQNEQMRVFVRDITDTRQLVVAQSTDTRNEIARDSALRTGIPTLILLPLLILSITWVIRKQLQPLRSLANTLDKQDPQDFTHLPDTAVPDEILPFIAAINRLLERVEHMVRQQRRFIADAAHELRTPLTALSLQAQNLSKANSLAETHSRMVPLLQGIDRARKLTIQLLDLARLQETAAAQTPLCLITLLRNLIADALPRAEAKQIDLGLDTPPSATLSTNAQALQLILGNGLENALRYTPNGGEITLRLSHQVHGILIEIIDTGPGIPVDSIEQAFEPFHRLDNHENKEGSGLGLAIAREAARKLGYSVTLTNRTETQGLIFQCLCTATTEHASGKESDNKKPPSG